MSANTINIQYGNIEDFEHYKDIEKLRHNKAINKQSSIPGSEDNATVI